MLFPKRAVVSFRVLPRATTRCLSTTAARPWATPTNKVPPNEARGGANPVDDIDLVFDYPTESQSRHEKTRLEEAGLDLHSAMPHYPKGQGVPGAKAAKDMGATNSNVMFRYVGLGALGLGGLYMMMRRRSTGSRMTEPGDLAAQKPAESNMEKVLGRGR